MTVRVLLVPESEHSALGPSSAHRWLNCPGSVRATQGIVDEGSAFAVEGTAAHAVAEECAKLGVPAEHFLDWTIRVLRGADLSNVTCDQEMVDGVNAFLDYVNEFPGESLCESRVDYSEWVPDGFGTMDRAKIDRNTVHIFDFKYGKGVPVDATDNDQLKLYGLGFHETFGWLAPKAETYVLHVVQPRLSSITSWAVSLVDLLRWGEEVVMPAALQTSNPKAPFKAGDWCTFCKIRATCITRAGAVFNEVVGDFENLDDAIENVEVLGPAFALTPDQAARILHVLPQIQSWCSDLEEYAVAELMQGHAVGDWKLVEGRASRKWALPENEMAARLLALGVPETQVYKRELVSVAQAEKIKMLGKKHELFQTQVVKTPGKPTLAPGNDKRPSISVNALTEFVDLDGESTRASAQ